MAKSPNIYLDNPDPLSVLLSRLELRAEVYVNGAFCGTWAVDTSGSRRIPFHLIGDGDAWLHFGKEEPRHLGRRDLVLFPHDDHHIIASSQDRPEQERVNAPMSNEGAITQMVCGFFEFRNPSVFPLLDALPEIILLRESGAGAPARIRHLVELILRELEDALPGSYAAVDQYAFLIFVEVLRRQVGSGVLSAGLLSALFDSRLGAALNAIHKEPEKAWTVDSLAKKAALSRSSFSSRFSKQVGMAPMKYLTAWRMTEARRLLTTTALSTAEVAERCGYDAEAAFRKAFKSTMGETPGAVRSAAQDIVEVELVEEE